MRSMDLGQKTNNNTESAIYSRKTLGGYVKCQGSDRSWKVPAPLGLDPSPNVKQNQV